MTEDVKLDVAIVGYLAEFRATATNTRQLSELEEQVIRLLPSETEVLQEKLAYHWQHFNAIASAVSLACLASDVTFHGTRAQYDTHDLRANMQAVTAQKRQFCAQHRIGIYLKNLNDASRQEIEVQLENEGT